MMQADSSWRIEFAPGVFLDQPDDHDIEQAVLSMDGQRRTHLRVRRGAAWMLAMTLDGDTFTLETANDITGEHFVLADPTAPAHLAVLAMQEFSQGRTDWAMGLTFVPLDEIEPVSRHISVIRRDLIRWGLVTALAAGATAWLVWAGDHTPS